MATKNCTICYEDKVYLAYGFLPCTHTFVLNVLENSRRRNVLFAGLNF